MNGFGFERQYGDEWAKFVKSVVLYATNGDNYLYADAEYETKVSKEDLFELFKHNVAVVNYDGVLLRPVAFKDNGTHADVVLWNAAAEVPAAVTLYSKEYA